MVVFSSSLSASLFVLSESISLEMQTWYNTQKTRDKIYTNKSCPITRTAPDISKLLAAFDSACIRYQILQKKKKFVIYILDISFVQYPRQAAIVFQLYCFPDSATLTEIHRHCLTRWIFLCRKGGCRSGHSNSTVSVVKRCGRQKAHDWNDSCSFLTCRGM